MEEEEDARPKPDPGGSAVALFLALYLLLLAFFILLNTISTFEEVKTREVQESLSSAFASILPPTTSLNPLTSLSGPLVQAQKKQEDLAKLFKTDVKVTKVEVIQPGKLMEVIMYTDQLFDPEEARLRVTQTDFINRLAATMDGSPDGLRYEVELLMGAEADKRGRLSPAQTLPVARVGAFARAIEAAGAPKGTAYVGLNPSGDPELVTFHFYWEYADTVYEQGRTLSEEADRLAGPKR